ncbi:MAG: aquaporin family protein [Pelagibacterales bacterium]|jgi:glycerol uptake facilitator protein|nr:aquaporin family protein [Pelagibacterales bacterium]MBT6448948.1 aquaporin family protein [Flavobacteriaceae bacterium]MBT7624202.1 aquaporin family protein [Flavobacteriaceae bacterium]
MDSFLAEFIGTTILMLLGVGVNANTSLKNTIGGENSNWVLVSMGWGLSVFVAVFITGQFSGAHLNPAVTIGLATIGKFSWSLVPTYIFIQLLGAIFGSWLAYVVYIDHYRLTDNEDTVRGSFCTGPAIKNYKNNFFSETIATFILVFGIFYIVEPNLEIQGEVVNFGLGALDALPVGILVWVIGMTLGGTTGFAINPARDFGPRLVYSLLPRKNKNADWSYSWVPIFGPFSGAILAGLLYNFIM